MRSFEPEALFGSAEAAVMFGRFTYESTVPSKAVTSPFAVFAKVKDGLIEFLGRARDSGARAAVWDDRQRPHGGCPQ